jgi:hypothetical protein
MTAQVQIQRRSDSDMSCTEEVNREIKHCTEDGLEV